MLTQLIEAFLLEAAALTKGSQRIMNDKKMVAALAARVRRDSDFNPSSFPPGADMKFEKAPDEEVARWFLENIDRIEREGDWKMYVSRSRRRKYLISCCKLL